MTGDQIVKRVLPVLMTLLVASCSSSEKGSAGKGQPAARDEKYDQALEYYTLTHGQEGDPNGLAGDGSRGRRAPALDRQTARRMLNLQQAMRDWRLDKPDARVASRDREAAEQIVERVFRDPASRSQMVIKTYDLKLCEKVSYQFHNKNRCLVNVVFYNRGPMIQAGLDLYLFKDKDQWRIVHREDWIG
jgi:hypothetical protein